MAATLAAGRSGMRRREILGTIGATALASRPAFAQKLPVVGFLSLISQATLRDQLPAFQAGLAEAGYTDGRNVTIDYRWANGQIDRLPTLAGELAKLPATVIVAAGGNYSADAAKAATSTIPIVFTAVSDPVRAGLVASFNKPGGNITGVSILSHELDAKRLELMIDMAPRNGPIGILVNPRSPTTDAQRRSFLTAAGAAGRAVVIVEAAAAAEFPAAFAKLAEGGVAGLVVGADPFFTGERARIVALANQHRIPAIYQWRQFALDGGLATYGPDFGDAYRQAGSLVGRILRGATPAELPVLQPTKFEFVLNLRTARAIGFAVPPALVALADEVIE